MPNIFNFLWITRENPLNPDRGDLMYSNGLLRSLLNAGAKGTLLCYRRGSDGERAVPSNLSVMEIDPPQKIRALSLMSSLPSDSFRLSSTKMARALDGVLAQSVDAVFLDYYAMGWCLPQLRRARQSSKKMRLVYVSHHYEQELRPKVAREYRGSLPLRVVLPYDASKAAVLERDILNTVDAVTTITENDRGQFLKDVGSKAVLTLTPGYDGGGNAGNEITADTPRRVILVGAFDWIAKRQNLTHFVTAASRPFEEAGIDLQIVGRADAEFRNQILRIAPACNFIGPVETILPYMRDARIGLMPDEIGGGFKLKYLDYIFNGIPIATIKSQAIGLPVNVDDDMIAAETLVELVEKIRCRIDDIEALNNMRKRAYEKCMNAFQWETRGVMLREMAIALH